MGNLRDIPQYWNDRELHEVAAEADHQLDEIRHRLDALEDKCRPRPHAPVPGRLVCAWCKRVIVHDYPTDSDSHGICPACYARELAVLDELEELGEQMVRFGKNSLLASGEDAAAEALVTGQASGGID